MSIFKDIILMIIGGSGSFGNAVLKHFFISDIGEIRIFSRDEKKQDEMRQEYQVEYQAVFNTPTFPLLNLLNNSTLKMAVRGGDSIFHAAALKQVPSCGFLPMEAVKTNVMGTDHVLDAAVDANCRWSPIQRLAADGRGV